MDYNKMSLDELKEYAKSLGMTVGNIGKEKLISKIKEKESESKKIKALLQDDDLDDAVEDKIEEIVDLPMDETINVKSIVYGGLTYKSRTTNAVFRWNQIGSIQPMTVAEINEMNNHKTDFLRKPLVILMDERAIKKFRLTCVYENVAKINNLSAVFNSGDLNKIDNVITDALSVNMRDILISKVRQMYKAKKLTDINILRLLEKRLQFDLTDSE